MKLEGGKDQYEMDLNGMKVGFDRCKSLGTTR